MEERAGGDGFVRKLKEVLGASLSEGIQNEIEGGFLRPLSVMITFVRQLFLPFAVCSVSPLRVAVHRVVPLPPAWLVPVRKTAFFSSMRWCRFS